MAVPAPHSLEDNSTYSKFLAIYTRSSAFDLLACECKKSFDLQSNWKKFKPYLGTVEPDNVVDVDVPTLNGIEDMIPEKWSGCDCLKVLEFRRHDETQIRGLVLVQYEGRDDLAQFHDWLAKLVVRESRVHFSETKRVADADGRMARAFAGFFEKKMKNTGPQDEWESKGRDFFIERAEYFTKRNLKIEAVLPAFPCKSSNLEKVAGVEPDKGEELAFRRLIYLGRKVKEVYPPGMKIYIVSDGHVFSDCIGVDDDVVDKYTEQLKEFYYNIAKDEGAEHENLIGFVSLKDLLFNQGTVSNAPGLVEKLELPHYTGSQIGVEAELSRKMLMAGCDTDAGELRKDLETEGHPRLNLFRGFSRFMCEDLRLHSHFENSSKSALKKVASKVAFEMIKRNDAYSNLVELLFPFHMRLSIHAHPNHGPKFGVRLISPKTCRVIDALGSSDEPSYVDLLHIPTPWHNTIIKIDGFKGMYMAKSKVVQDAIASGHYAGSYKPGNRELGDGGCYHLTKIN